MPSLALPPVIEALHLIPEAGSHEPDGKACAVELRNRLYDLPWSDQMKDSPVIAAFLRRFWDGSPKTWPGIIERIARGDFAPGKLTPAKDKERAYLAADRALRVMAPRWLRVLGNEADAAALEAIPAIVDAVSARAAEKASSEVRSRAWKARDEAWAKVRNASAAASAAAASSAAASAAASSSAAAAYAAAAAAYASAAAAYAAAAATSATADAELKGKSRAQKVAYFRERIEAELAPHIEASIADGFDLLDDLVALTTEGALA